MSTLFQLRWKTGDSHCGL